MRRWSYCPGSLYLAGTGPIGSHCDFDAFAGVVACEEGEWNVECSGDGPRGSLELLATDELVHALGGAESWELEMAPALFASEYDGLGHSGRF